MLVALALLLARKKILSSYVQMTQAKMNLGAAAAVGKPGGIAAAAPSAVYSPAPLLGGGMDVEVAGVFEECLVLIEPLAERYGTSVIVGGTNHGTASFWFLPDEQHIPTDVCFGSGAEAPMTLRQCLLLGVMGT